ncbi:hypothetical protein MLD38_032921 [Melastoma candidum]|nr:hypothetical protein MLD38_032921 [Melastoma candidum]
MEKNCLRNGVTSSWCPSQSISYLKGSIAASVDSDMVSAVNTILSSVGEDLSRKELVGTPVHFLKWLIAFRSAKFEMKSNGYVNGRTECIRPSLEVNGKHDVQIQSELNLSFWSQCEHHLLPFHGVVHIGYLCHEGSKHIARQQLQSIVNFYGFKLQVQERLTRQIAESVSPILGCDVMVVIEANHICMISRGIEKFGSNTATVAVLGQFSSDPIARSRFLSSIPNAFS